MGKYCCPEDNKPHLAAKKRSEMNGGGKYINVASHQSKQLVEKKEACCLTRNSARLVRKQLMIRKRPQEWQHLHVAPLKPRHEHKRSENHNKKPNHLKLTIHISHQLFISHLHPMEMCVWKASYCLYFYLEGYLPSVLVNGSTMGRVDTVAVPVDPLDQSVVARPSDWVQSGREAALGKTQEESIHTRVNLHFPACWQGKRERKASASHFARCQSNLSCVWMRPLCYMATWFTFVLQSETECMIHIWCQSVLTNSNMQLETKQSVSVSADKSWLH